MNEYKDSLFIACDVDTGAIYFASRTTEKLNELKEKFTAEHPQLAKNMVVWYSYENNLLPNAIKAMEKGATTHRDVYIYTTDREVNFVHYIYTVKGRYECCSGLADKGIYSDLSKAKAKAVELMREPNLELIEISQRALDTNEEKVIKKYKRDKYDRFVKVKGE